VSQLTLDVVSISQTTEFLLTSSVPDVEPDRTSVCVKNQRMYLNTQCGCQIHSSPMLHYCNVLHTPSIYKNFSATATLPRNLRLFYTENDVCANYIQKHDMSLSYTTVN